MTNSNLSASALALSGSILAAAADGPEALAGALASALVTSTRADGSAYVHFAPLSPVVADLARDVAMAAHDGGATLPDDWTFSKLADVLAGMADDGAGYDPADDCDTYTRALLGWLADGNAAELNEWVSECGWPGSIDRAIQGAQCAVLERIVADVWAALVEVCDDLELDAEAEGADL